MVPSIKRSRKARFFHTEAHIQTRRERREKLEKNKNEPRLAKIDDEKTVPILTEQQAPEIVKF